MSFDDMPETLETGEMPTGTGEQPENQVSDLEGAGEQPENPSEDATGEQPVKTQKRLAGVYDRPEDLEKAYMQQGYELNQLKAKFNEFEQKVAPKTTQSAVDPRLEALYYQHYEQIQAENPYEEADAIQKKAAREARRDFAVITAREELEELKQKVETSINPAYQAVEQFTQEPDFAGFGKLSKREKDLLLTAAQVSGRMSGVNVQNGVSPARRVVTNQHLMADKTRSVVPQGNTFGIPPQELAMIKSKGITGDDMLKTYAKGAGYYNGR